MLSWKHKISLKNSAQIHKITLVLGSLFDNIASLQPTILLKEKSHTCFFQGLLGELSQQSFYRIRWGETAFGNIVYFLKRFCSCEVLLLRNRIESKIKKTRTLNISAKAYCLTFIDLFRTKRGSKTAARSKVELFVIIVNDWKSFLIIKKSSFLDVATALDPPLRTLLNILNVAFCGNSQGEAPAIKALSIFANGSIIDVWNGPKHASDAANSNWLKSVTIRGLSVPYFHSC